MGGGGVGGPKGGGIFLYWGGKHGGVWGAQREEESFYIGEGNIGRQKHLPFSTISQGNM